MTARKYNSRFLVENKLNFEHILRHLIRSLGSREGLWEVTLGKQPRTGLADRLKAPEHIDLWARRFKIKEGQTLVFGLSSSRMPG